MDSTPKRADAQIVLKEAARLTALSFQNAEEAINASLELIGRLLETRTLFLARFDSGTNGELNLNVIKVLNKGGPPLELGNAGPLYTTFCNTFNQASEPLIIENVGANPFYRELPATAALGIGSYIGVPLVYRDGRVYGSLCGIDSQPLALGNQPELVGLLQVLSRFLITQIELEELNARLQASDKLKSLFMGMVSHDLRQPLSLIMGYSQLIRDRLKKAPTKSSIGKLQENAGQIERSAQEMLAQVNELLEYSKAASGREEVTVHRTLLRPLIKRNLALCLPQIRQKNLRLSEVYHLPDNQTVAVDEAKFGRIVLNLLSNAVKFSPPGRQIQLHATTAGRSAGEFRLENDPFPGPKVPWVFGLPAGPGSALPTPAHSLEAPQTEKWLAISVVDQGEGMPLAELPLIFEEYRQLGRPEAEGTNPGGAGLGLAIVNRLTGLLGGQIAVRSEVGRGSCFSLFLPLTVASGQ